MPDFARAAAFISTAPTTSIERKIAAAAIAVSLLGVSGVSLLVFAMAVLSTVGHDLLPRVMAGNHYTASLKFFTSATWLFSVMALGCLYRRRRSSALDLWLAVVMCAWVFDVALSAV